MLKKFTAQLIQPMYLYIKNWEDKSVYERCEQNILWLQLAHLGLGEHFLTLPFILGGQLPPENEASGLYHGK